MGNNRIFGILSAILLSGIIAMISEANQAFAVSCNAAYGKNCYIGDYYFPNLSVNGVESKYKALEIVSSSPGWLVIPTWITLIDTTYIEVGYEDLPLNNPKYYWGTNGDTHDRWGTPTIGSSHTFRIEDLNQDTVFNVKVDGVTKYTVDMDTAWSNKLETGYEFTYTDHTILVNDFSNKKYGRPDTGWVLWNSASGTHSRHINPNPISPLYFVEYCGTGAETYYHSQHGQVGQPITC